MNNIRTATRLMRTDAERYRKLAREAEATGSSVPVPTLEDDSVDDVTEVSRERIQVEALLIATAFQAMSDKLKASLKRLEQP